MYTAKRPAIFYLTLMGLSLTGVFTTALAMAGNLYIVAYPGIALTEAELKEVYLGERQFAGSTKLVPVDNVAAQADFLNKVMKMDAAVYGALWIKKSFRAGMTAPEVKSGDAEIYNFVNSTPGAVGYISAPTPGEPVLHKF